MDQEQLGRRIERALDCCVPLPIRNAASESRTLRPRWRPFAEPCCTHRLQVAWQLPGGICEAHELNHVPIRMNHSADRPESGRNHFEIASLSCWGAASTSVKRFELSISLTGDPVRRRGLPTASVLPAMINNVDTGI